MPVFKRYREDGEPYLYRYQLDGGPHRDGLNQSQRYEMIRIGEYPKPVPTGQGKQVAWLASEIEAWIEREQELKSGSWEKYEAILRDRRERIKALNKKD